ncbi:hypothetical protein D3C72_1041980 [compost metagenome]
MVLKACGVQGTELSPTAWIATVASTAPITSISRIEGRATCVIMVPRSGEAEAKLEAISRAMDDSGVIAQPTQKACFQLAPLPGLAMATPEILVTRRTPITASTTLATGRVQSAWAATIDTSTNISMVSSDEAVPSWRCQAQGLGLSVLSSTPPMSAASGAEPPMWAVSAAPAAMIASSRIEVFSLFGLITRSAERSASAMIAPTTNDMPSTTATG